MRVEPHSIGSVLHIMKRGARGGPIVQDEADKNNFLRTLFYLNDEYQDENWRQALRQTPFPERPAHWPEPAPLVDLWAWTLMSNHFHLIVREKTEGGIAKFMQRLCGSMSAYTNAKYKEKGSLFQGSYKGRVVNSDVDLQWLASYVMVKNTFELMPGGLASGLRNFDTAWQRGLAYPFSSLRFYAQGLSSPLISENDNMLRTFWNHPKEFKHDAHEMLQNYVAKRTSNDQESLVLE